MVPLDSHSDVVIPHRRSIGLDLVFGSRQACLCWFPPRGPFGFPGPSLGGPCGGSSLGLCVLCGFLGGVPVLFVGGFLWRAWRLGSRGHRSLQNRPNASEDFYNDIELENGMGT